MRDLALAHYDRILVHTDPQLIPFDLTFPFAAALRDRLVDTGYVVDAPPCRPPGEPRHGPARGAGFGRRRPGRRRASGGGDRGARR